MIRPRLIQFTLILVLALSACNLPTAAAPTPLPQPTETSQPATVTVPPAQPSVEVLPPTLPPTLAPSEVPAPTVVFTATLPPSAAPVTISATGNLNVRRGPGVGYNPVGGLLKGQSATASARDANGDWLLVTLPASTKTGWVSSRTKFSTLTGDLMSLPVMTVDPPKPAYFLNCTFHPMLVQPAGVTIPPQSEAPLNLVQFNPGEYNVKDASVAGEPTVLEATLFEGQTLEIRTDGIPNTYACP